MKERIREDWGAETVLVFGPESVSYERSRRENRTILREISARDFFGKITTYRKKTDFQYFQDVGNWKNQISNISRIGLNQKSLFPIFPGLWIMLQTSISNISRRGIIDSNPWSI